MNEMIERVAKVAQLFQGHPGVPASAYEPLARLMIEAMREPTETMLKASGDDWEFSHAGATYTMMIDAALTNSDSK